MQRKEIIGVILVVASTLGTLGAIFGYKAFDERDSITLTAQAPEKGNWSPRTIPVEEGKEVILRIRNADVVSHGFYLPSLNIVVKELKAGEVKELSFTAFEAGEYPFYCVLWCSDYHMQMRGEIVVR